MLFYIRWKARPGNGPKEADAVIEIFSRWQPPEGVEIKGMWGRSDGDGFCVCDAATAEAVWEAIAPWSGSYLDYEVVPIFDIEKAVDISNKAAAFRDA